MKKVVYLITITILLYIGINGCSYKTYGFLEEREGAAAGGSSTPFGDPSLVDSIIQEGEGNAKDPDSNPSYYKPNSAKDASNANGLAKIGNTIIGVLQIIGSILSVAVLAVMGIKYMIGSVEEKAEYKKSMGPYIIGAVMVFAITNLLSIVVNIATDIL